MYKNFDQINEDIRTLMASSVPRETISRIINVVSNAAQSIQDLPDQWARAYAGVQTVEYDSDGHVSDVTTPDAISTVNATIARATGSFSSSNDLYKSLKANLGVVGSIHVEDQRLSEIVDNAFVDIKQFILDLLPMSPSDGTEVEIPLMNLKTSNMVGKWYNISLIVTYKYNSDSNKWFLQWDHTQKCRVVTTSNTQSPTPGYTFTYGEVTIAGVTLGQYSRAVKSSNRCLWHRNDLSSWWQGVHSIMYSCGSYICSMIFDLATDQAPEGTPIQPDTTGNIPSSALLCDVPSSISPEGIVEFSSLIKQIVFSTSYVGTQYVKFPATGYEITSVPNDLGSGVIAARDVDIDIGDLLQIPDLDVIQDHLESMM